MSPDPSKPKLLVMAEVNPSQRFIDCLAARDFHGMAEQLVPGASARFLLPRGAEEQHGRGAIVGRFKDWFAAASQFDMLSTSDDATVGRRRLSWRFRVVRRSGSPELIEQLAFMNIGPEGIERLDLLCSGFEVEGGAAVVACELLVFDAGNLGCADGLAQEFRRRMAGVPVGASLTVVVADPAAKEDLPPLARMLGHTVKAMQPLGDGRLTITVERRK
jgi:TusA-related sulfurtransferase